MKIVAGIFETHLEVKNLRESMDFYENKLGLTLGRYEEGRRRAFYLMGEETTSMISIIEQEQPNLRHMAFRVSSQHIDKMIPYLHEKKINILPGWEGANIEEPMVYPWLGTASVFFNDIDGNRLEFIAVLPEGPRPNLDQVFMSLSEWNHLHSAS